MVIKLISKIGRKWCFGVKGTTVSLKRIVKGVKTQGGQNRNIKKTALTLKSHML